MPRHPGAMRNNKPGLTLLKVCMGKSSSARSVNQACTRILALLLVQLLQGPRTTSGSLPCHEGHFTATFETPQLPCNKRSEGSFQQLCGHLIRATVTHHLLLWRKTASRSIKHQEESEEQSGGWTKKGTWLGANL